MYRIQANGYFHSFRQIYSISVCHVYAKTFFQCRTSVRETVFNYEVLWFLCIYKWCNVGFLSSDDWLHIFHTQFFQICCNLFTRTRCNLIDHRPWKCNYFFIAYIIYKSFIHESSFLPFLSHSQYRFTKFCAILGAVIHGNQCDWIFACFVSLIKHCDQNCHCPGCFIRSILNISLNKWEPCAICFLQSITFFCNRKGNHLQGTAAEDLFQAFPLCFI